MNLTNSLKLLHPFMPFVTVQAEDGDRRPWLTFVLVDLSLESFYLSVYLRRRFIDSDDLKVIVDGKVKRNHRSLLHKFWYFIASLGAGERQTETFTVGLPMGLHYLELYADRQPVINEISFRGLSFVSPAERIKEKIRQKSKEYGFDPEMMLRLAKKESEFNPKAVSPAGAKGLFQLMPDTIEQIRTLGYSISDPFEVDQNINGGTIYLRWLYGLYLGDEERLEKTLAAWSWGLRYVPKDKPLDSVSVPVETRKLINYVLDR